MDAEEACCIFKRFLQAATNAPHLTPHLLLACMQSVLAACPHPRNGVYNVSSARLAAVAQRAPSLVLQELRSMAAGNLIGFELSREEGLAYEVRRCRRLNRTTCLLAHHQHTHCIHCIAPFNDVATRPCPHLSRPSSLTVADPAAPRRPGRPCPAGALAPGGGAGVPGGTPRHLLPSAGGGPAGGAASGSGRQRGGGGAGGTGGGAQGRSGALL